MDAVDIIIDNLMSKIRCKITPSMMLGILTSSLFGAAVSLAHVSLFDLRANPRMILQPWLLQHGFLQYVNIADEHSPLLPQILAWLLPIWHGNALPLLKIFQAGLIFVSIFLCLLWLSQAYSIWAALAAGLYIIAWSNFGGFWALWYELALAPLYLIIFIILVAPTQTSRSVSGLALFVTGIVASVAILIKQQAVLVALVPVVWLILERRKNPFLKQHFGQQFALYLSGILIPLGLYAVYFGFKDGNWHDLFYWLVTFNLTNNYEATGFLLPTTTQFHLILQALWILIPFAVIFLLAYSAIKLQDRNSRGWLLVFLAITAIMQYPRYSNMHWATMFPFVAIGAGIVGNDILEFAKKTPVSKIVLRSLYAAILLLWGSGAIMIYLPRLANRPAQALIEYSNIEDLAGQLKASNYTGKNIVLFPDNEAISNLYYLLEAKPPDFWLMTYPWFMNEFTREHWIAAVESEKTPTLILFDGQFDWTNDPALRTYIDGHYQTIDTLAWQNHPVRIMTRLSSTPP